MVKWWRLHKRKRETDADLSQRITGEEVRWECDVPQQQKKTSPISKQTPKEPVISEDKPRLSKAHEETAQKELLLRKKELRWKLLQANQARCRAKLEEIRTEANYHKQKLMKAKKLAAKLRAEYLEVIKSARLLETQSQKANALLQLQEKYFTEEKLQTTKLALDCMTLGAEIYGAKYKLPNNSKNDLAASNKLEAIQRKQAEINHRQEINDNKLEKLSPFLRTTRSQAAAAATPSSEPSDDTGSMKSDQSVAEPANKKLRKSLINQ